LCDALPGEAKHLAMRGSAAHGKAKHHAEHRAALHSEARGNAEIYVSKRSNSKEDGMAIEDYKHLADHMREFVELMANALVAGQDPEVIATKMLEKCEEYDREREANEGRYER